VILEELLRDFQSGRLSITVAATSDASSTRGGVDGEVIFASLAPGITSKFEAVCGGIAGGSLCVCLRARYYCLVSYSSTNFLMILDDLQTGQTDTMCVCVCVCVCVCSACSSFYLTSSIF
jgi:hypothetical protein